MLERHDALIFDCDGVLINSEEIAQEVELTQLASVGIHYRRDEYAERFSGTAEGHYRAALCLDAETRFAVELGPKFFDEMSANIGAAYAGRLEAIIGASMLASAWPKGKAVASSSATNTLLFKLRKTGLDALFGEHIYSADVVGVGKPDPAIFLFTAAQLGVAPARCMVVEDSVNGIVAAKRAGMTAIGFTGGGHCLDDHAQRLRNSGADLVFAAHADLAAHLALAP
jgi:beta-phosphoglucomutase-like phosphatase (HAD superfamily)